MDDRKVDGLERVGAEAWATGGKEAETEAKRDFVLKERDDKARSFQNFQRVSRASVARLQAQREAQAAQESAREDAAAELEETGNLAQGWVASATGPLGQTSTSTEEPQQQSELKAKVQAFLSSRSQAVDSDAAGCAGDTKVTAEPAHELEECPQDLAEASASNDADDAAEFPADVVASLPEAEVEFAWTSFRDKRLGSLTAECRYDFKKVALRLSEEFSCAVDVDACRQQYRKLIRPIGSEAATEKRKTDAGRAKDASDLDPDRVQEVSKWFVHQISSGQHARHHGAFIAASNKPKATTAREIGPPLHCVSEDVNVRPYAASGDGFHDSGCLPVPSRPEMSTVAALGSFLGDMEKYAPQQQDVTGSLPEFAPRTRVPAAKASVETELFELD